MSRNNNIFSEINGYDTGSRYDRRHPVRKETVGLPGSLNKMQSRISRHRKQQRKRGGESYVNGQKKFKAEQACCTSGIYM